MNCEKFESLLLDELYGELDELTSAAMRKHAQSCSQCAPQLEGLKRARLAFQRDHEVPSSLEARILSAVADAEQALPIGLTKQNSGWISRAGRWAMRPQTAMAALFMLMLGSSAVLMHSRQSSGKRAVSVEEMGSPEAKPAEGLGGSDAPKSAAGAMASAVPRMAKPRAGDSPVDEAKEAKEPLREPIKGALEKDKKADDQGAQAAALPPAAPAMLEAPQGIGNAGPKAGSGRGLDVSDSLRGAGAAASSPMAEARSPSVVGEKQNLQHGLEQYRKRDFENARRTFQNDAKSDPTAALWAARSARDGSGKCNVAVKEFDAVAKRAQGTATGDQATLESAKCLRAMGAHAQADARLRSIENSPTTGNAAKAELDANRGYATNSRAPASPAPAAKPNAKQAAPAAPAAPATPATPDVQR